MPHTAPPTRADLFAWWGTADDGEPGDVFDLALSVALRTQAQRCQVGPYTPELHAAALRRAARFLAAKGLTLGASDAGDFGTVMIPRWDAEIESYEAAHRVGGFA